MRVAVLSDIHANLHALEAVLADVDRQAPDEIWSLGDVVGYGPRPNECVSLVHERATLSLCGNHDLAALGALDTVDFSGDAGTAARWTRSALGADEATWLRGLEPLAERPGVELFHGSPRDRFRGESGRGCGNRRAARFRRRYGLHQSRSCPRGVASRPECPV